VLRDRLAHRLAGLRVLEREVGGALGDPQRLGGDSRPRAVEDLHSDLEPVALLAHEVRRRNAAVVEEQLAGGRALDPHLRFDAPDLETGGVPLDHEARDPRVACLGIRLGEDRVEAGHASVRDKPLRPVEDVVVPLAAGLGSHRRGVRARAGLGEGVRREPLAGGKAREKPILLLLAAGQPHGQRTELVHRQDQPGGRAGARDLLDRDEDHERAGVDAAVALLEGETEEPVLTEEVHEVFRKLGGLVDLGRSRGNPLLRKSPYEAPDLALLVAERIPPHARDSRWELPAAGDAHVQMVVVAGENLDDGGRAAKARVRPDEDARRTRLDEEIDERLRERKVDLVDPCRRPLAPVEAWVIDIDVEPVLMRDVTGPEPASPPLAQVPHAQARCARVPGGVRRRNVQDPPDELVGAPAAPGAIGSTMEQGVPGEVSRAARRQLHAPDQRSGGGDPERARVAPADRVPRCRREAHALGEGACEAARDSRQEDEAE
jgi:hypothetical protein